MGIPFNWLYPGYCHMTSQNMLNIGSGNGLVPSGTKPLPEPMLTNQLWGLVTFTIYWKCSRYIYIYIRYQFENDSFKITATSPRCPTAGVNELMRALLPDWCTKDLHTFAWCLIINNHQTSTLLMQDMKSPQTPWDFNTFRDNLAMIRSHMTGLKCQIKNINNCTKHVTYQAKINEN